MLEQIKNEVKTRMEKTIQTFSSELKSVRTGRATPSLLEHLSVEAYGGYTPLSQLASVTALDSRMLSVQVWDRGLVKCVEKAINASELGVNASAEGQVIRVPLPPLSEERRKDMVKLIAKYAEQAKVALRNIRRDGIDLAKKNEKDMSLSKDDMHKIGEVVQKLTDDHIKEIDSMFAVREKEILHM